MDNDYILPVVLIESIRPLLEREGCTYASEIIAKLPSGKSIKVYENKGLDLSSYVNSKMECVLEITQGIIYYEKGGLDKKKCFDFKYVWPEMGYVFFPALKKIREELDQEDLNGEERLEELYEKESKELFSQWGLNGFGIDSYSYKSMLKIEGFVFYINEYEFEEDIDDIQEGDNFFIVIEEVYLRGIRPFVPIEEREKEEIFLTPEQKEEKARREAIKQERREAVAAIKARVKKRREAGEGPTLI